MHYPRAPSSPPPATTDHHLKEQDMQHHSSSSPAALSPARPEGIRGHKAGHFRNNDVPPHLVARDIVNGVYEEVIGPRPARHRKEA